MTNVWKAEVARLIQKGAEYCDVRYYPQEDSSLLYMQNGNMLGFDRSTESGYGVRVLLGGAWGFAASSDLSQRPAVFDRALANAAVAAQRVRRPISLLGKEAVKASFTSPCQVDPFTVPVGEQVELMKWLDSKIQHSSVLQRVVMIQTQRKTIEYYDSEGAEIKKHITEIFPSISVMGLDSANVMHERKFLPTLDMRSRGWETMRRELWEPEAERIVAELGELLQAPVCPSDVRSVILLPDIMFLQTHETIGHALELDRILGYELSYAGGSFVRLEDFGHLQYGSSKLTVRADATLPNSPGSFGFDDDGVPCRDNLLIDKGVLVGAISSRQMVVEANERAGRTIFTQSGAANRATSFARVPIERMTNINIDPGTDGTLADIVAKTERGLILSGEKSWSIGSNREQFHFATDIGWLVEDGQKKGVVRHPAYGGATLPFYRALSAVGDASTWELHAVNNCGKGAPAQVMQLGHGIPVCRFDQVKVGE